MAVIAITGAEGFVGWHLRAVARARGDLEVRPLGRDTMSNRAELIRALDGAEHVVHLAGVNRGSDEQVYEQNVALAEQLGEALRQTGSPPASLSFANSIQAGRSTAYGEGKARAAQVLAETCQSVGTKYADERLPNLFGEHGRPHYNSVVATFCHEIAHDRSPTVRDDKQLTLLGVRDAAARLLDPGAGLTQGDPTVVTVSELRRLVEGFHASYRTGEIPTLGSRFRTQLFNTYRSYLFPQRFPISLERRTDPRGSLIETVRVRGGGGQAFVSTTRPGVTRGQHFHLDKVERFVVVEGEATISLRRLFQEEVVTFRVSGDAPAIVDMPTLWTHNLTNVGWSTLYTQFWTDQLFEPERPDTYYEDV